MLIWCGSDPLARAPNRKQSSDRKTPMPLKIPPQRGGIYTTENGASPFQAEPAHLPAAVSQRSLSDSLSLYQDTSTGIFFSKDLTPSLHQIARCPVPRWFQPLLDPPWR